MTNRGGDGKQTVKLLTLVESQWKCTRTHRLLESQKFLEFWLQPKMWHRVCGGSSDIHSAWSSYVAFWVEIGFQEISGILKANNSVDNLCRWVLVHFHFIIMSFNQSQQFDGLFSISAPIGHNQAQNAILFCRKPQYFEIARLFENISGQPPFRVKNI